jgi:hypothetical protein
VLHIARITGIFAALIWVVGAPLVVLAGVPFPSDAQYLVIGAIAALLGLTMAPVALAIGGPIPSRKITLVRISGLAVFIALITTGVMLILAVEGWFGARAARTIADTAFFVLVAPFCWITVASIALRGRSTVERWIFWLGVLTGATCLVPVVAAISMFYFAKGFVLTNATIVALLIIELALWACLPAWITAVLVRFSEEAAG